MLALLCALSALLAALATPLSSPTPRPLVIWHGLGDSHSSPGMLEFAGLIKDIHPGIFVHSVYLAENLDADQRAGFFGNVDEQVEFAAAQLANITELAGGFDAIGFSQGGQFLRAYVERHNTPPVRNLITFGSQHMGVSDLPACPPTDLRCLFARRAAHAGVYRKWAQENLIQAQYFRDPTRYAVYLSANAFLTSINGEVAAARNATYKQNLASLENLVLVLFARDRTVVPKESSWFGSAPVSDDTAFLHALSDGTFDADFEQLAFAADPDAEWAPEYNGAGQTPVLAPSPTPIPAIWPWNGDETIIPMRLQPLYTQDWIGLRLLDERGAVHMETCDTEHMHMPPECWEWIVKKFCGSLE